MIRDKKNDKNGFDDTWRERLRDYKTTEEFKENLDRLNKLIEALKTPKVKQKKLLVLLMGIPGSGKSAIAEIVDEAHPSIILQTDAIYFKILRYQIEDDYHKAYVYAEELAGKYLDKSYSVIIDDNCRTKYNRSMYYKLALDHDAKPLLVNIVVDVETAMQREIVKGKPQPKKERLEVLSTSEKQIQQPTSKERKILKVVDINGKKSLKEIKKIIDVEINKVDY